MSKHEFKIQQDLILEDNFCTHSFNALQYVFHAALFPSGHQSGDPQSSKMRTSSTCKRYDRGDVSVRCPPPDNGVNVIIARYILYRQKGSIAQIEPAISY